MTPLEVLMVITGLFFGYWIVSYLFDRKSGPAGNNKKSGNYSGTQNSNKSDDRYKQHWSGEDTQNKVETNISNSWFHILEISESANKDEIITAYRHKISQYHPDKVANMGKELQELAESKSKQINAAYDYALKIKK